MNIKLGGEEGGKVAKKKKPETHIFYEKFKKEKNGNKNDVLRLKDTEFTVYIMDTCETS